MSEAKKNFVKGLIRLCQKHGFEIDYISGGWESNYSYIPVFKNENGESISVDDIYTHQELIKKGQRPRGYPNLESCSISHTLQS